MGNNPQNKKFIITETRDAEANEFIFADGYYDDAEKRRLWKYLEDKFGIVRENIPSYLLSRDNSNKHMSGFRIIKLVALTATAHTPAINA